MKKIRHKYDSNFYIWVNKTSKESAKKIIPIINSILKPKNILDVGCGNGVWLSEWQKLESVEKVTGIDGYYINRNDLFIKKNQFRPHDLTIPFDFRETFALVQSLEVAEHIPKKNADNFISSIQKHGDAILFSAAHPGQGGENHINEQPPEYWRDKFSKYGFEMYDCIRPKIKNDNSIAIWYRLNIFLFLRGESLKRLDKELCSTKITNGQSIKDYSSITWKFRKLILRKFSPKQLTIISRLRYRISNLFRK
jgi:SAM-dependent methyltransferase